MTLQISAVEHNAVFQVYQPGAQVTVADGVPTVTGTSLPGAGEGDDAGKWEGVLPATGRYLIVVGAARGGASYRLSVSIGRLPG